MVPDTIRFLSHIIKINQKVAFSVGPTYLAYLSEIFNELIQIYKLYSECISSSIRMTDCRPMKTVRRDILKLIQTYIEKEINFDYFNENFLPTLQTMVEDYYNSDKDARDPETLMLFATVMKKEGNML